MMDPLSPSTAGLRRYAPSRACIVATKNLLPPCSLGTVCVTPGCCGIEMRFFKDAVIKIYLYSLTLGCTSGLNTCVMQLATETSPEKGILVKQGNILRPFHQNSRLAKWFNSARCRMAFYAMMGKVCWSFLSNIVNLFRTSTKVLYNQVLRKEIL